MNTIVYYDWNSKKPSCYRANSENVCDYYTHKVTAFVKDDIWYSSKTFKAFAFEKEKTVFDYTSFKPILFREDA